MKLGTVLVTLFLTFTNGSQSLVAAADTTAQSIMTIIKHARKVIHDERVLIESAANGMTKYSSVAANDSTIRVVHDSLENIIVVIQNATKSASTVHVEARVADASSYAVAAPSIIEDFTDIGSDLTKVFVILLDLVNNSSLLQALAGDLINGLLEFLQVFGTILRTVPGIQTILNAIGKLIGSIPI